MISAATHNEAIAFILRLRDECDDFETFKVRLPNDVVMAFPEMTPDDGRRVLEDLLAREAEEAAVRAALKK